jgi:hypothetical protein
MAALIVIAEVMILLFAVCMIVIGLLPRKKFKGDRLDKDFPVRACADKEIFGFWPLPDGKYSRLFTHIRRAFLKAEDTAMMDELIRAAEALETAMPQCNDRYLISQYITEWRLYTMLRENEEHKAKTAFLSDDGEIEYAPDVHKQKRTSAI